MQNAIKHVAKFAINAIISAKINASMANAHDCAMKYAISLFVMNHAKKN